MEQFNKVVGNFVRHKGKYAAVAVALALTGASTMPVMAAQTNLQGVNSTSGTNLNGGGATGTDAAAFGTNATASGSQSVAVGQNANATGNDAVAIENATASGLRSIAIGNGASSTQQDAVSIGTNAITWGSNSVALGNNAKAASWNSVVIGFNAYSSEGNSVVIGPNVKFDDTFSSYVRTGYNGSVTAIGTDVQVAQSMTVAIGVARALAQNSIAIATHSGYPAITQSDGSLAVGNWAIVYTGSDGAQAIGRQAQVDANSKGSLAIGAASEVNGANSIAIGGAGAWNDRTNAAVTKGANSVSIGSAAHVNAQNAVAMGYNANVADGAEGGIAIGQSANSIAANAIAIGNDISATAGVSGGEKSILLGYQAGTVIASSVSDTNTSNDPTLVTSADANKIGTQSIGIGVNSYVPGNSAVAVGNNSRAQGDFSLALGVGTFATGRTSVAVGQGSTADSDTSTALGAASVAENKAATALGAAADASAYQSVALGAKSVADRSGFYDATTAATLNAAGYNVTSATSVIAPYSGIDLVGKTLGAVSVGSDTTHLRQITNVGDATQATDAVNLRQLQGAIATVTSTPSAKVTGTGAAVVTGNDNGDGSYTYNVHVDQTTEYKDASGNTLTKYGDNYYTADAVAGKVYVNGQWYNSSDVTNGVPNSGAQPTTAPTASTVSTISVVNPTDSTQTIALNNLTSNLATTSPTTSVGGLLTTTAGLSNAVTLQDLQTVALAGLNFTGNDGQNVQRSLSQTLTIKGEGVTQTTSGTFTSAAGNVNVVADGTTGLTVQLNKNLVNMTSISSGDGTSATSGTAATITLENGTAASGNTAATTPAVNVNGARVTNVGTPTANTDAATKGYVDTAITNVTNETTANAAAIANNTAAIQTNADNIAKNAASIQALQNGVKAAKTVVTGTGAAVVTQSTNSDGATVYNVQVDQTTAYTDASGNTLTKYGDNYYTADAVAGKTYVNGNWYNTTDVTNGQPSATAQPVAAPTASTVSGVTVLTPSGTAGNFTISNVKSAIGGSVGNGVVGSADGQNTFLNTLQNTTVSTGSAATVGDVQNLANSPIFAAGDVKSDAASSNSFSRKLGQTINIVGGVTDTSKLSDNNIGVVSNGTDTLTVKLAKDLSGLNSISVGTASSDGSTAVTTINSAGVTVSNGAGKSVSLTPNGLDNGGNPIHNVGAGKEAGDVATVGQMNAMASQNQREANIGDSLNAALSALKPLQYDPLEPTQIMAGVGYYRGQGAVALGVAHYQNESLLYNVGASFGNSSHIMLNAGVTWKFGDSKTERQLPKEWRGGAITSMLGMETEIKSLRDENADLRNQLKQQGEDMKAAVAKNQEEIQNLKAMLAQVMATK